MRDGEECSASEAAGVVLLGVRGVVELVALETMCMWSVCVISDAGTRPFCALLGYSTALAACV
jgi:hypothetical protein